MKKQLDVSQVLKSFTGEPLKEKEKEMKLKDYLLAYLANAGSMGLNQSEKGVAYALGMLVGMADGVVSLAPEQYDLLKKICDNPVVKVETAQGDRTVSLGFPLHVTQQVKIMVDSAETVKEGK